MPLTLPAALANSANSAIGDLADDSLPSATEILHWSARLSHAAIAAGAAIAVALVVHYLLFALLRRIARRSGSTADSVAVAQLNQSVRWALVAMAVSVATNANRLVAHLWDDVSRFVVPGLVGWVLYALVSTFAEVLSAQTDSFEDEIAARSRRTRVALLSRSAGFVIIFITIALVMLGLPGVAHIGATLMASAGLIGIAFGAAAQPVLKSLFAGLQIAMTQPIRIGDVVVVENEAGRVEDIHLSYVVIRTPDERRLIVPTTKFLDTSFQNWTRVGGITGSVVLPVKPGCAIAPIRAAYERLLAEQAEWDRRTGVLLVSEARVGSVELKLVMSASDPTALANLRQFMREAMLDWLRTDMPEALCAEI